MSSPALPRDFSSPQERLHSGRDAQVSAAIRVVEILGSLKLTCVLFALSMIIVFSGSLAQSRRDVWQVMEQYFRTWVAWIDIQDLFPPSMFSGLAQYFQVEDFGVAAAAYVGPFHRLPFPGGWTIGLIMLINLTSAHSLKFRVRARGNRLATGLLLVITGLLMTFAVVWTGNLQTGVEFGNTLLTPKTIWYLMLAGLAFAGIAGFATAVTMAVKKTSGNVISIWILASLGLLLLAIAVAFLIGGEAARFNLSNMRILWQLLKGFACALVLLLGSNLLFEKRGGIAVLHFGVAMLMISELQVGLQAKETMLSLLEGESTSFVRDIRVRELAIITQRDDGKDDVYPIPESRLEDAAWYATRAKADGVDQIGGTIDHNQLVSMPEELPFDLAVRRFYRNSTLRAVRPDDELRTASGLGSFSVAEELRPVTGMEESNDTSAVYVDLIARDSGKVIDSILVSQNVSELRGVPLAEKVTVAGKDYQFYLRFQRSYQPYTVKLNDVSRTNYIGTSTPRDYRSEIEITEAGSTTPEKFSVWMNNPLRFKGETFYQTGHQDLGDGREMTTLSVVNNQGWMLPYIACMIVMVGMFGQFGQTLSRFLDRTVREVNYGTQPLAADSVATPQGFSPARPGSVMAAAARPATTVPVTQETTPFLLRIGVPAVVAILAVGWLASKSITPKEKPAAMNLYGFAQLPVAWSGRPQPIDSMARMQLLAASHKSTCEGEMDAAELSTPERRKKILATFANGWPSVDSAALAEFDGTYSEWIQEIAKLTASGNDAIEARMRPVMVRKMPAVEWLLDVMTRPELAARHRIFKIEDDRLLSLLGLEKRGGLTYSLVDIQKNFKALEPALKEAQRKQRDKLESSLTPIERRVGALFETMGRIDQLSQVFILRNSDGLLGSYVDSWRVLHLLGKTAPVSPVPTGSNDEQRAFETMIAANSVRQLNDRMTENHIVTLDDLKAYVHDKLPAELVTRSITGSYRILRDGAAQNSESSTTEGIDVQLQAKAAAGRVQDEFLSAVLKIIADADPTLTPEQIAAAVPAEKIREIAASRISSDLFEVFSTISESQPDDKRLMAIRTRLQKIAAEAPQVLASAMNEELIQLVWDDLQTRVGHLMPGGQNFETFNTNALAWNDILTSWERGDAAAFNKGVNDYRAVLTTEKLPHLDPSLVRLEAWFNYFEPFYLAINIYLPIIVMSFLGWLFYGASRWIPVADSGGQATVKSILLFLGTVIRNTSLSLLGVAFVLHTAALILRMWISGRPPVTNLYSSAIFIGWAVVFGSFFVEMLMKRGIGNLLGASVGAATLVIAHYLARDEGDNLGVMQAVLDTTFWLATHVVCITLGYAATIFAGCMGFAYCLTALFNPRASGITSGTAVAPEFKLFGKMVYGVICFALFFSLVGTVLGGLWADDSWGRFWGWDPKENGAMMIVLWNAFILHARWDKMVRDYGTAVLAMIGNVVTAWSWFGVNELKAGLHTYGFTEGRLFAMLLFIGAQLAFVAGFAAIAFVVRKYFSPPSKLKNA